MNYPKAGFIRRLAALIYDLLLAASIVVITHLLLSVLLLSLSFAGLVPLEHYQEGLVGYLAAHHLAHLLVLVSAVALFFVWFWTHGGQTLGMKAWKLRVQNEDNTAIHLRQAIVRVCFSFGGLGNLLILLNPKDKLALQDRLSDSMIVVLPKEQNRPLPR